MPKKPKHTRTWSYIAIAAVLMSMLTLIPKPWGYTWNPIIINLGTTLMFLLLVYLTAKLARTDRTGSGVLLTGLFIFLFCPGAENFFLRDEQGLMALCSQCMVPFFISQYTRIRRKEFKTFYALMLAMGIFCSYTHSGVTIPLCLSFLWMSLRRSRRQFFKKAYWPMVLGFAIGTTLSLLTADNSLMSRPIEDILPETIHNIPINTLVILKKLWDTKVFVIAIAITGYMIYEYNGRKMLLRIARRHYALTLCLIFSFITMPLAPLGKDNAVTGVCFFCMFWLLFLAKYMAERYWEKRI